MLRPRVIPALLVKGTGLVKTKQFASPKYVGDPINAVRTFNDKEVDELIVLDIDATTNDVSPNLSLIEKISHECSMPLCYGGGIRSVELMRQIISLGVEKVALSSAVLNQPDLVQEASQILGSQSVVVVLDVKKTRLFGKYEVVVENGTKRTGIDPVAMAKKFAEAGCGEIVINSVDQDGVMQGYDLTLVKRIKEVIDVPLTCLGGAGSLDDIQHLINQVGTVGAAAGSLFVFKGKYKAVLINYPTKEEKLRLFSQSK